MKLMRILSLFGFILMALPLLAQTEDTNNTIKPRKKSSDNIQTLNYNNANSNYKMDADKIAFEKMEKPQLSNPKDSIQLNFNEQSTVQPVLPDYINNATFPVYKHLFLFLEGERCTYLNFAGYTSMQGALGLKLNNHFSITGGLLAIKQFSALLPYGLDRSGVKFILNYNLNDKANFSIWNQYITDGDNKVANNSNLFMPQTGSGAAAAFKIGRNSQIGISTQYQFDDQQKKWNQESKAKVQLKL